MAKRTKYGNQKCVYQGMKFDSKLELQRWQFLNDCLKKGKIKELKRQQRIQVILGRNRVCDYIADFSYEINNKTIYEDVKGVVTAIFRLKAKLIKVIYDIDIKIVKKENITSL